MDKKHLYDEEDYESILYAASILKKKLDKLDVKMNRYTEKINKVYKKKSDILRTLEIVEKLNPHMNFKEEILDRVFSEGGEFDRYREEKLKEKENK